MNIEEIAYKIYRIFEDSEIENNSESNWRCAEQVIKYFQDKNEDKIINQDLEELFNSEGDK